MTTSVGSSSSEEPASAANAPMKDLFVAKGCEDWRAMTMNAGRRTPREVLREQRSRILSLLSERGGRDVRVFGSLARGDDDVQSDIDLLIELPGSDSAAAELLTVLGLSEELSELIGAQIDVVTPRTLRDEVREAAIAEAVPL